MLKLWSSRADETYEQLQRKLMMKAAKTDRRVAARKVVDFIHVAELTSLSSYSVIAREAVIADASRSGFLLRIERAQLIPKEYRENLSMTNLVGHQVVMYLPQMNLDLDGTIIRADHIGKGRFEVACTFSQDVPEYWRECLVELLPAPGEIPNTETETETEEEKS